MKKKNLLVIALFICVASWSQSDYASIQYNKTMQPAHKLELANSTEQVKATILEKLKQSGYKPETEGHLFWKDNIIDGFYVFKNIVLPSLGSQKLDMYFKVVQKNEEEKNNSILYLLVSTGNENFTPPDMDTVLWNRSTAFLNGFIDNTIAYSLEQDIIKQQNTVGDSQKKLTTLQKDEKELENKMKKIQEDIRDNQSNQKNQQLDIETQKKSLENLKLKRK